MICVMRNVPGFCLSGRRRIYFVGSASATIVLAIVLVVCLLVAQLLVSGRAGVAQLRQAARENAAKLFGVVSAGGLDSYLGRSPVSSYYIWEQSSRPIGYGASVIYPKLSDGDDKLVFSGREFYRYSLANSDEVFTRNEFTIANDLSAYSHKSVHQSLPANFTNVEYQVFDHGRLSGHYQGPHGTTRFRNVDIGVDFLIPPALLDLFSALIAGDNSYSPSILGMVEFSDSGSSSGLLSLSGLLVRADPDVPSEIAGRYPDSPAVAVEWLSHPVSSLALYDSQRRLVWQNTELPVSESDSIEIVQRSVDRVEMLEKFPQAELILDTWLMEGVFEKGADLL